MRFIFIALLLSCALATFAQTLTVEIRRHNGRPMVFIDGKPNALPGYSPMAWDKPYTSRQLPRFAPHKMGVYYISPPVLPSDFFGTQFWVGDQVSNQLLVEIKHANGFRSIDDTVELALKDDPGAYIIVRFGTYEPASWKKIHPEQYFVDDNGKTGSAPSLASDVYFETAAKFCTALIQYCESRPWANRVIGYANFYRTEGVHEPSIGGELFDHSPLMTARWRRYLKAKYQTDEALRAAYNDKTISLETIEVPKDKLHGATPDVSKLLFWQGAKDNQPLRDYLLLQRDLFHQRSKQLFAGMKAGATQPKLLIYDAMKQTMQGWNCGDFFTGDASRNLAEPELMTASGSMNVADLFDEPGFDGLITPHDYQARGVGGIFEPEGIVDSMILRGKVFVAEMDTRTYPDKYNGYGKAKDDREVAAITWRNLATALTRGFGFYWMDLSADWFSNEPIQQLIGRQVQVVKESVNWEHDTVPGIAMIIDDQAALETNGDGNYALDAVMWEQKMGLARCGVPYRIYLLDDLKLSNFPKHRVFYFPNLFKVDDERLALLKEKVFRDGNVVVWGPGSGISDGVKIGPESAEKLTGFKLAVPFNVNYSRRTLLSNFDHPITKGLDADTVIGSPLSYGPILFPQDGTALGLAWTKQGRNETGLAVKEFGKGARGVYAGKDPLGTGDYASVFTTAVPLPAPLWRNLARYAGAHVYSESGDVLLADKSIVALHSLQSGEKRIALPGTYAVYDVITGKLMAKRAKEIKFTLQGPETRVFRLEAVK
ncbi:MAG: alpha-amylase family protein [Armatimonadota bacterium]